MSYLDCQPIFLEIERSKCYFLSKGDFIMRTIIGIAILILAGTAFIYLGIFGNAGKRKFNSKAEALNWIDSRHTHGNIKEQLKLQGIEVIVFIDPPEASPQTGKLSVIRSVDDGKWELVISADRPERKLVLETRGDTINIYDKKTMQKILIINPGFFTAF